MRLALLLALLLGACTPGPAPAPWEGASLELLWSTGSLPPAYHYAEATRLSPIGGTLGVALGYGAGPDTTFAFEFSNAARTELWADLRALGLWDTRWAEERDPPVGGSSWRLRARDDADSASVPAFVVPRQAEAKEALRERVAADVPADVRAAADAWRAQAQSRLSD